MMNDNIVKSICTMGVWGAAAAIIIWSHSTTAAPIEMVTLIAAGFSTAAIWNYKISTKKFQLGNEMVDAVNNKMENA